MEDKLATLIGLLERLLQAQPALARAQLHPVLVEAMERFERDLPLTTEHVARLLDVSVRTVRRIVPIAARSKPGGTIWYSRREVETVWQVRARSDTKRGTLARRAPGTVPSHSVSAHRASPKKKRPSTRALSASDDAAITAVETRLRNGSRESSKETSVSLRLIPSPSPDGPIHGDHGRKR